MSEILPRAAEKVLAVQSRTARENPDLLARLVRAHARAADFVEDVGNREEVAAILAPPNRIGVSDGTNTEISGDVQAGDAIIVGAERATKDRSAQ